MDQSQRRHVGRIVFTSEQEWTILTLKSHVENVTTLAAAWQHSKAYLGQLLLPAERTRERLIKAAEIHDDAKPSHFRLVYKEESHSWEYSFAGHRFAVDYPSDPYVESLVHLHHEYSVEGITTAIATLRNRSDELPGLGLREIAPLFPLDLYALEMADQIEATLARSAVDATDPEERVFMDFQLRKDDSGEAVYRIEPFPFQEKDVQIEIEYMTWQPPQELLTKVVNARPESRRDTLNTLKDALERAIQELPLMYRSVILRPWFEQEGIQPKRYATVEAAYRQLTDYSIPNPMQRETWDTISQFSELGIGLLVKGPTGSGKTEAIAVPAMAADRRLILIYPTRSLVDDQIGRMRKLLQKRSLESGRPVSLCVDTGAESLRMVWANGEEQPVPGNIRRHLYHADVIITTLDKFLYRYFGFGEPQKSYIFPLRIHYGLKAPLICFDEAHSYDDVALTNFSRLVRSLYEQGRDVVLMTATMPEQKERQFFSYFDTIDYVEDQTNLAKLAEFTRSTFPERQYPGRSLTLVPVNLSEEESSDELTAAFVKEIEARYRTNERTIAVVERVQDAVAVWRTLRASLAAKDPLYLYHGRLTQPQRKKVYDALRQCEAGEKGYVLITTSAIEVGCDLDAHTLISQRCDPDRLIQRAGRCNRKQKMTNAAVVVVGSQIPSWLTTLSDADMSRYEATLQAMDGNIFGPKTLMACLQEQTHPVDYRVEMMFDMLHEYIYSARIENRPLHEKGLIITRSWEPSITIGSEKGKRDVLQNAIEVPLRSCKVREGETLWHDWHVAKRVYNAQERKQEEYLLSGWECAYSVDLVAYDCSCLFDFDEEIGWVDIPKLFSRSFTQGYRRIIEREANGAKQRLWYISDIAEPEPVRQSVPQEAEAEENEGEEEEEA